jgi:cytochrome c-type biogenesis protein CcmH/NrfG
MKQLLISLLLIALGTGAGYANNDSLMAALTRTIPLSATYDQAKIKEIAALKQGLNQSNLPPDLVFDRHAKIYEAYKVFNYDSAYSYAVKLVNIAHTMPNPDNKVAAQLKLSFILLSAGLYKETFDSLSSLANRPVPATLKGEYYTLWGRYYYDLAGYASDNFHSVDYDIKGNKYLDTALTFYDPHSFEFQYYSGLRNFKENRMAEAASFFDKLLADSSLDDHQLALVASTYSAIYLRNKNTDKAIDLLVQATLADIKSSTKETVAIFHLSELLHKKGDLKHAAMCIESAISNAEFYGARQRKLQASSILPLIEGERINGIEAQKSLLIKYAILVTVLVLALVALTVVILKQVKKLKQAKQALTEANAAQQVINRQLEETNKRLAEVNEKLQEANKIKEEYIGYFFNVDSEFYSKLDKIKTTIEQKLLEKRYDDIRFFLNKIDARKEKDDLLLSFDKIFIKLFPHFVTEVNALLREDERIALKEGELLSTDLRIFALMRMGVTDPEKIAQILEYSVKTIYSYKSRVKNKAALSGDEFEEKVMQIKSL